MSAMKNKVSVAKGSAGLVDSAVFPEYWVCCMQPGMQAKTFQKQTHKSKTLTIINNSQLKEKGWWLVKLQDRKDTELLLCQMERRWVWNMPWLSTLGLESAVPCVKQPACLCLPMPESLLTLLKKQNIY